MVTVTVEKKTGATTTNMRVTAASVERAVSLCGAGARLVFPIDPEAFFTDPKFPEETRPAESERRAA